MWGNEDGRTGRHCTSLIGQSFSALRASSLENVTAVCGLHSLSEAMLLFSLTLFRLIGSEHFLHLLALFVRKRLPDSRQSHPRTQRHPLL